MANITSVSIGRVPANRTPGVLLALVGLVVVAGCWDAAADGEPTGVILGAIALSAGVALALLVKDKYVVRIGSASGETDALVSEDRDYIETIVDATNEAIIGRG
jgi:hypothetical protein